MDSSKVPQEGVPTRLGQLLALVRLGGREALACKTSGVCLVPKDFPHLIGLLLLLAHLFVLPVVVVVDGVEGVAADLSG
jgi:hypothetical protein